METPRLLFSSLRRFAGACGGIAATEFALIAPVMITLYFGITELSDGLVAQTKVTSLASAAADLIAQDTSVSNDDMADVFSALNAIMFPYPTANTKIVISSLVDAGNGKVKVAWSSAQNTDPRTANSVVPIPDGLVTSGSGGSVIFAEVSYDYSSPAGQLIYGKVTMHENFYLHPRKVAQIGRTS